MPSVVLTGVSKSFPGNVVALQPTNLAVEAGTTLVLLGPTGSGKSTVLRLIAGLEDPDAGEIWIGGTKVNHLAPHKRGVAMLPQRVALYPHLTIAQNLQVSSSESQVPSSALQLDSLMLRYPHQLSGGEKQRVGWAKLLLRNAPVWLLDEPFAGLDPMFRAEFRAELPLLARASGATIILVTHDPIDAWAFGHSVGVLGNGSVQQVGPPDDLRAAPGNRFVAHCLGQHCLVDGTVGDGDLSEFISEGGAIRIPLPDTVRQSLGSTSSLTLGIRPEEITTVPSELSPGAVLSGWPVVLAEPVGSGWRLTLAQGRTRVQVGWPSDSPPPVGAPTTRFLPADKCLWFDGQTGRRIY